MVWRLLNNKFYNIFENMAIDEAIFQETIKNKKPPTIRFYGSHPAAVSIGYFQDLRKEINIEKCNNMGIDIVRRQTGGKAAFHFEEITYSVIARDEEKLFPPDILGTYKVISKCIARGLAYLGIKANLAENGRDSIEGKLNSYCFSSSSKNELLVGGRKICGSAQVRRKGGFLQHGSLLLSFDPIKTAALLLPTRTPEQLQKLKKSVAALNEELLAPVDVQEVCLKLKEGFINELGIEFMDGSLTLAEETLKNKLMEKYSNALWNIEGENIFN
jgi:lipoate-protein ligase A